MRRLCRVDAPPPLPDQRARDSGGLLKVRRVGTRLRNLDTLLAHSVEMELDCCVHLPLHVLARGPRGDAPRKVGRIRREASLGMFHHDEVSHGLNPACRLTLAKVPEARSSPGLPAMVTTPGFAGCQNCRWLPRVRTSTQPSSSMSRMTSRTFTASIVHPRPVKFNRVCVH